MTAVAADSRPAGASPAWAARRACSVASQRASIVARAATPASVPVWPSQGGWLADLAAIATQPAVDAICRQLWGHYRKIPGMEVPTMMAVMTRAAKRADHATGRNVAVAKETLAAEVRCSTKTVQRAWQIVAALGRAVEAARGTRGQGGQKLTSVWHLITPKPDGGGPHPAAPVVSGVHLPPSGGSSSLPLVENYSPSARAGAPDQNSRPTQRRGRRCWRTAPRPLALQRLAGQLVAACCGLGRGHIGAICDAITSAGIDPQDWSARQLCDALNADMRATGTSWPDRIQRPGAFLASRLRRLQARHDPLTEKGGGKAAPRPDKNDSARSTRHGSDGSSSHSAPIIDSAARGRIVFAQAEIRRQLANARLSRQDHSQGRQVGVQRQRIARPINVPPNPGTAAECVRCGALEAQRRAWLPARLAHVCDHCWDQSAARAAEDGGRVGTHGRDPYATVKAMSESTVLTAVTDDSNMYMMFPPHSAGLAGRRWVPHGTIARAWTEPGNCPASYVPLQCAQVRWKWEGDHIVHMPWDW